MTRTADEPPSATPTASSSPAQAAPEADPIDPALDVARRIEGDPLAKGDVDAPVVMVEYADFRCSFCALFATQTAPELQHYIDDGILRIEWRDLPFKGDASVNGALAGRTAAEQGRFWEFHDAVYAAAPERGTLELTEADLLAFAKEAGVPDLDQFTATMKAQETYDAMNADFVEGLDANITGTPGFVINGDFISGAQPLEVFTAAIDKHAANAQ